MRESVEKNQNNFKKKISSMSQEEFNRTVEATREDIFRAFGIPRHFVETERHQSGKSFLILGAERRMK